MLEKTANKRNRYDSGVRRGLRRLVFIVAAVAVVILVTAFAANGRLTWWSDRPGAGGALDGATAPAADHVASAAAPPPVLLQPGAFQRQAERQRSLIKSLDEIGQGETFGHSLERLGLDGSEAALVVKAASEVTDLTKVRPGSQLTVFRRQAGDRPVRVEYTREGIPTLVMIRTPAGYAASWQIFEPVRTVTAAQGAVRNSLWGTAVTVYGLDPELVMNFVEIFSYDVDFLTDVQSGDTFRMLYEEKYVLGESAGAGRILAAQFVNEGQVHEAFYHEDEEGQGGYYDAKGTSLKKMFLKSPLVYRRISSYFSRARMHPILKYKRPHLGIDYAAPIGTPVSTIGDGKVVYKGTKGGYGRMVVIRHNGTYTSQYAHLSKYGSGIKVGARVEQGQVIGYVGSSGLSTGPHLDFRVQKNNNFIDPLSMKLEPAPPLAKSQRPEYLAQVERMKSEMNTLLAQQIKGGH